MKKIVHILIISIFFSACSTRTDDEGLGQQNLNSTPSIPELVFPSQDQLCITNTLNFTWNASTNTDGSSVIYTFEIATDNQFLNIVESEILTSLSKIVTLDKGVAYYWRVKARSTKKIESDYSKISQFYTEEVPNSNNLPFSPALVAPFIGQNFNNTNSISLSWTASDVDKDPLKFDILFGKDKNALTLVSENSDENSFQVSLDSANTTYYWKVIVKDDKGAKVSGPIWHFKTNDL